MVVRNVCLVIEVGCNTPFQSIKIKTKDLKQVNQQQNEPTKTRNNLGEVFSFLILNTKKKRPIVVQLRPCDSLLDVEWVVGLCVITPNNQCLIAVFEAFKP